MQKLHHPYTIKPTACANYCAIQSVSAPIIGRSALPYTATVSLALLARGTVWWGFGDGGSALQRLTRRGGFFRPRRTFGEKEYVRVCVERGEAESEAMPIHCHPS